MAKSHMQRFYEHVFGENIDERAMLLFDSLAGDKDQETMKLALARKNVDMLLFPENNKICPAS
jgi:hypothetical protein